MAGQSVSDQLDEALEDIATVKSCLEDAYTPEASREDLATAIGSALDTLEDYESEDEEEDNGNGDAEADDDLD
jgi:hypothetical protein